MDIDTIPRYNRCHPNLPNQSKAQEKNVSRDSLSDEVIYSYDYIKGKCTTDACQISESHSRADATRYLDEHGLSFAQLLKKELSKKKSQETGSVAEEYKDNYFQLLEKNQRLTKSVDVIKNKIKQYKHVINNMDREQDAILKDYVNQWEEFKGRVIVEKSKHEDEKKVIFFLRSDIRDVHKRIEVCEGEILKTIDARKNAEADVNFKECEIVNMKETYNLYKQKLIHVYKDIEMMKENSKRLGQTKRQVQEKINAFHSTNEKIKMSLENLLLDNETLKLENKSLEKVLKAHENICLELVRIAAAKIDAHNDTKTLYEITTIMKTLDGNKAKYVKQKQKIQLRQTQRFTMEEQDMNDSSDEEYHEAMAYHDGNGDGANMACLRNDLK